MLCNVFFLLHNLHTSRQQELALAILDLFFINRQPLKLRRLHPIQHGVVKMNPTEIWPAEQIQGTVHFAQFRSIDSSGG